MIGDAVLYECTVIDVPLFLVRMQERYSARDAGLATLASSTRLLLFIRSSVKKDDVLGIPVCPMCTPVSFPVDSFQKVGPYPEK